jgi:ammonia channel protein AmtB
MNLVYFLITGILFLYVGIHREKTYGKIFAAFFYLGLAIILYHLYKIYGYLNVGKEIWVNILNVFIIGPLVVYIGYHGENTSRKYFEVLMMVGFASIGYYLVSNKSSC